MNFKLNPHTLFLGVVVALYGICLQADSKEYLQQLLQQRPELAKQFLGSGEEKPVVQPSPEPQKSEIAPVEKKLWLTEQEKNEIDKIFTTLETYTSGVFNSLESFFSRQNCLPYRLHVTGFKNQLNYLRQNLIQNFPQTKTVERQKLFSSFFAISKALEQSQELLCGALDRCYDQSIFGAKALADQFDKIEAPLKEQRSIIGRAIQVLNSEFRTAPSSEAVMVARLLRLAKSINKIFDYGHDKSVIEIASILIHRIQR